MPTSRPCPKSAAHGEPTTTPRYGSEFAHVDAGIWICFFFFWGLNIIVILRGIETIKILEGISAPFMLAVGLLLLWWITQKAGGFAPVLSQPSKFHNNSEFFHAFIPSL